MAASPVGHILRGATTTPGRARRSAAASSAVSETSADSSNPPQLSQRPQGPSAWSSS